QHKNTLGRVHTNADNLRHGRLLSFEIFCDLILAHRCRRGPSTPTYAAAHRGGTEYGSCFRRDDIPSREFGLRARPERRILRGEPAICPTGMMSEGGFHAARQ